MDSAFVPIASKKNYEAVSNQIIKMIKNQTYPEGSRLPTEAELTEVFQVGRNSVREAIKSLQINGIVVSYAGKGTFVAENAITNINLMRIGTLLTDKKRSGDLAETRLFLEQQIAGLAAIRWDDRDMAAMEKWMTRLEAATEKEDVLACGHMFHQALGTAAHNEVLVELHQTLSQFRLKDPTLEKQTAEECKLSAYQEHKEILDAIKQRDQAEAERLAREHILKNYSSLLKGHDK